MSYGYQELYPTLIEKAAALGFSLINNHPFVDGNKRIGYAAIEVITSLLVFLVKNGIKPMIAIAALFTVGVVGGC